MNKFTVTFLLWMIFSVSAWAQSDLPSKEDQIKAAVSPAPEDLRDEAKVLGYNEEGELVTLREGSNDLICLADDPQRSDFHVNCYYKDLDPFMQRGRELRAEGKSTKEIEETRQQEIEEGELPMPEKPMALYTLTGPDDGFDYSSNKLQEADPLYVVYIPYATEETTGIHTSPVSKGAPWLMDPGKPWAHIMISTGHKVGEEADQE